MTTRAVVLAAGRGGRLLNRTDHSPKCLVRVAGRPLIEYVLGSLHRAGVTDTVVVIGYRGEQIEAALGDGRDHCLAVRYAWNREYQRGNASSLARALPLLNGDPFLLVMGDHLCSASLLRTVLAQADGRSAIATDASPLDPEQEAEATKVAKADGRIVDIGKELPRWDAVDTGVSHWAGGAFAPVEDLLPEGELAALMTRIARAEGGLAACDVTGHFWMDIDTEGDLCRAERLLSEHDRLLD